MFAVVVARLQMMGSHSSKRSPRIRPASGCSNSMDCLVTIEKENHLKRTSISNGENDMSTRTRWVLAFDASCNTCREISAQVSSASDGKLEVLPLNHPDVQRWRQQGLGVQPPWAPTLLGAVAFTMAGFGRMG